jgi:hypothetical protein
MFQSSMILATLSILHSAVFAADAVYLTQFKLKSRVMHLLKESHHSNEESSSRSALPGLRSHSFSITAASLLQVLSYTKLDPPFESITPECQRMENFWMNQCVTASPGSGLMKNNDPSKTKHGTRR